MNHCKVEMIFFVQHDLCTIQLSIHIYIVPLYSPLIYLPNSARLHLPFDWILSVMCFNFHALLFSSASCSCMVIVLLAQIWLKWLHVYHLKGPHLILSQPVWSTLGWLTPLTHTVTMGFWHVHYVNSTDDHKYGAFVLLYILCAFKYELLWICICLWCSG